MIGYCLKNLRVSNNQMKKQKLAHTNGNAIRLGDLIFNN